MKVLKRSRKKITTGSEQLFNEDKEILKWKILNAVGVLLTVWPDDFHWFFGFQRVAGADLVTSEHSDEVNVLLLQGGGQGKDGDVQVKSN